MELAYRFVNGIGRVALHALRVDVHWSGVENLPAHGPVLMAANHVAYPDFVFIERAAVDRGRYVRFMTRHDVWHQPIVENFMKWMQHVPVDRDAPVAAYLGARNLLRQGEAVCVFPEAGVSYAYTIRALMPGVAALARETGVPVVPVAVWGSQRLWSVGDPDLGPDRTRGRRVDVAFGVPLYADPDTEVASWTGQLGHTLTEMLEQLQARPAHQPRPGEVATWHPAHLGGAAPSRARARELDLLPGNAVRPTWGGGPLTGAPARECG